MFGRRFRRLKEKAPRLILIIIVVIVVAIVTFDTVEDTLIEGGSFAGTPLATVADAIIGFVHSITATVSSGGYSGIFLLMLLESSSLPIPSEVILPFSGYLVSIGKLNFWIIDIVSTIAGITGSLIDYYIGVKGTDFLARRRLLDKLFDKTRLETAKKWSEKYGSFTVFFGRIIPGFRTLISFPAGALKMPMGKFLTYTTGGCLIWNTLLIYLGLYLGTSWRMAANISRYLIIAAVATIIVGLVVVFIRRNKVQNLTRASLI